MATVSFHELEFSFDKLYLTRSLERCRSAILALIRPHLTDKSQDRCDQVFDFITNPDFLDCVFRHDSEHRATLGLLVTDINKALDAGHLWLFVVWITVFALRVCTRVTPGRDNAGNREDAITIRRPACRVTAEKIRRRSHADFLYFFNFFLRAISLLLSRDSSVAGIAPHFCHGQFSILSEGIIATTLFRFAEWASHFHNSSRRWKTFEFIIEVASRLRGISGIHLARCIPINSSKILTAFF